MKGRMLAGMTALVMTVTLLCAAAPLANAYVPITDYINHDEAVEAWINYANLPDLPAVEEGLPLRGYFLVDFDQDTIPELVAYYSDNMSASRVVVHMIAASEGDAFFIRIPDYPCAGMDTDKLWEDTLFSGLTPSGNGTTGYLVRFGDGQYGLLSRARYWHGASGDSVVYSKLNGWGFDVTDEVGEICADLGPGTQLPGLYDYAEAAGPAPQMAYPSTQSVDINGTPVAFHLYARKDAAGNDTNYVKLRDVAYALQSTSAGFNVNYDGGKVRLTSGQDYVPNGTEMFPAFSGEQPYKKVYETTEVNGVDKELDAIRLTDANGGGHTYYKLRDLGAALGFTVSWDRERGIYVETPSAEYDEDSFAQRWMHNAFLQSRIPGNRIQDDWYDPYDYNSVTDTYVYGLLSDSVNDFVKYQWGIEWTSCLTLSYAPVETENWSDADVAQLFRELLHVTGATPDIGLEAAVEDFMDTYRAAAQSDAFVLKVNMEHWADGTTALETFINGVRTPKSYRVGDWSGLDEWDDGDY